MRLSHLHEDTNVGAVYAIVNAGEGGISHLEVLKQAEGYAWHDQVEGPNGVATWDPKPCVVMLMRAMMNPDTPEVADYGTFAFLITDGIGNRQVLDDTMLYQVDVMVGTLERAYREFERDDTHSTPDTPLRASGGWKVERTQ